MGNVADDYELKTAAAFIERLRAGQALWQNDVRSLLSMPLTVSDARDVPLSGGNALILAQKMWDEGWRDPRFFTARQIDAQGARLKAESAAIDIPFFRANRADGSLADEPEVVTYTLFNAAQIEGLGVWHVPERHWTLEALADRLLTKFEVGIIHDQAKQAFFSAEDGNVHMPPPQAFSSIEAYVGVAVHELAHASRGELGRSVAGHPGEVAFAQEELRAELASMQLSIALGIPHDVKRHAGFVNHWIAALENDPGELFRAARDAEKMAALVLWHVRSVEQELAAEHLMQDGQPSIEESVVPASQEARTVYSVYGDTRQDFEDVNAAAVAFLALPDSPSGAVVRTMYGPNLPADGEAVGVAESIVDGDGFQKVSLSVDATFDAAMVAAREAANRQAASLPEAQHVPRREVRRSRYEGRAEEAFANRQTVLAVPYNDRNEAKQLGAMYYRPQQVWFVPEGVALPAFRKWMVKEGSGLATPSRPSEDAVMGEFEKAMKDLNVIPPKTGIVADCKWHHVSVINKDKPNNRSGSYVLNMQGGRDGIPCGVIMNRHSGEQYNWKMDMPGLTPEQLARMRSEALAREAEAERALQARYTFVAKESEAIWALAKEGAHGYFERKMINGHGARVIDGQVLLSYSAFKSDDDRSIIRRGERYALLPLVDEAGKLWALQAISEDGKTKAFMSGGRKKGLFCVIGADGVANSRLPTEGRVDFVEGFATGASFFEKLDWPTVVCFDAGNMEAVAASLAKSDIGNLKPVFAADNDQFFVERAFGLLAKVGVVAHGPATGPSVAVVSGKDSIRQIPLGEVQADGEWHQAAGGRYRVEMAPDAEVSGAVGRIKVEIVRTGAADGQKETMTASNRGLDAARKAVSLLPGADFVLPSFDRLAGRPTDWNDLAVQGGDLVRQVHAQLQIPQPVLTQDRGRGGEGRGR